MLYRDVGAHAKSLTLTSFTRHVGMCLFACACCRQMWESARKTDVGDCKADLDALHALHDAASAALCDEALRHVPQAPGVHHAEVRIQHECIRRFLSMRLKT